MTEIRSHLHISAVAVALCLLLAACGGGPTETVASPKPGQSPLAASPSAASPSAASPSTSGSARTLTVYAAGSLTAVFTELGKRFEADNPGVSVKFNFDVPSATQAAQIVSGTPVDVFAAASDAAMKTVTGAKKADGEPVTFATNVLVIATAPGNPKGIASFADLAKPNVKVAICAPTTACGMATVQVEQGAGVMLKPASEEQSLKAVLSKVTTGSADAGLVYASDVVGAKNTVVGVTFPESSKAIASYPIAVVKGTPQADLAKKFLQLVTGESGQKALQAAGFKLK